jgi:hypothetical protein
MLRRVLFIEDGSSSLREECRAALNCVAESVCWESPFIERLRERRPDLVVPVAIPSSPSVGDFFQWLAKNPVGAPTPQLG